MDDRNAAGMSGGGDGDVDERWPVVQQSFRSAALRIDEEADLCDVQDWSSKSQRLVARGSSRPIKFCEAVSSHGLSYRRSA